MGEDALLSSATEFDAPVASFTQLLGRSAGSSLNLLPAGKRRRWSTPMSSHAFTMFSPTLNCDADICVGYDSAASEPFLTFESPLRNYMSHGKQNLAQVKALASEKLGIELPAEIVAAVEHDMADTRIGLGGEVNRRFKQYIGTPESAAHEPGIFSASITHAGDKLPVVSEASMST